MVKRNYSVKKDLTRQVYDIIASAYGDGRSITIGVHGLDAAWFDAKQIVALFRRRK